MKKFFALTVTFIFVMVALVGCTQAERDENLVGTWRWYDNGGYTYVFNADGTGTRGFAGDTETFTWSTSGDRLNVRRDTRDSNIRNERWTYTISDYALTINSQQETNMIFTYLLDSGNQDSALVGVWAWSDDPGYTFVFNANGTGTRGYPNDSETFNWSSTGNRVDINSAAMAWGIEWERWTFTINGNNLNLNSQQAAGLTFDYIRN